MKYLLYLLLLIFISQCKPKIDNAITQFPGKPVVPSSIKKTHEQLLEQIHKITLYKNSSAAIAIKLDSLMQHHFKEEEDLILPPLGLLPLLANNQIPEQSKDVILLSKNIKTMMTHMSVEHQLISAYIEELKKAADKQQLSEIMDFEKEVHQHANSEEEVYFPAAIMVGEYLKLKSEKNLPN